MSFRSSDLLQFSELKQLVAAYAGSAAGKQRIVDCDVHRERHFAESELADAQEAIAYLQSASAPQKAGRGAAVRLRFDQIRDVGALAPAAQSRRFQAGRDRNPRSFSYPLARRRIPFAACGGIGPVPAAGGARTAAGRPSPPGPPLSARVSARRLTRRRRERSFAASAATSTGSRKASRNRSNVSSRASGRRHSSGRLRHYSRRSLRRSHRCRAKGPRRRCHPWRQRQRPNVVSGASRNHRPQQSTGAPSRRRASGNRSNPARDYQRATRSCR